MPIVVPRVESLQQMRDCGSQFCLNCQSTGSVATSVLWSKNREQLTMNSVFSSVQILEDGITSTYNNKLLINSAVDDILGEYKCIINNTLGLAEDTILLTG